MGRSCMIVVAVALPAASRNNAAEGRCVSSRLTATESACATQCSSETSGSGGDPSGPEGACFGVFMLGMMLFCFGILAFVMVTWAPAVLALWDCAARLRRPELARGLGDRDHAHAHDRRADLLHRHLPGQRSTLSATAMGRCANVPERAGGRCSAAPSRRREGHGECG